jgi:hypothetical protein
LNIAFTTAVRITVELLVRGEYAALETMTRGRRLSAAELRGAVEDYGRRLILPPEDEWSQLDVVEITGSDPAAYHVVVDQWTEGEGRSDLSLELELEERHPGAYQVEVQDCHVLQGHRREAPPSAVQPGYRRSAMTSWNFWNVRWTVLWSASTEPREAAVNGSVRR